MKNIYSLFLIMCLITNLSFAQEKKIQLWPDSIPNQKETKETEIIDETDIIRISNVQVPTLEVYLPAKKNATGQAVIICPGGGYGILAYDWEGSDIAKWLNSKGIAAFVLKYRLPNSKSIITSYEAPLQDAQRAIRIVRKNAEKWHINDNQIGIMGFSAGGHLASTIGTHYESDFNFEKDAIDMLSARPDFMILIYPVITMKDSYTHQGSKNNLLGKNPNQQLIDEFSNEMHINSDTPPTFIIHSTDDKAVPVMNSILFYQALSEHQVASEMHIYPKGGHGYGLAIGQGTLQTWTNRLGDWLDNFNDKH